MKKTLLKLVQNVLSDLDSDEVNSIDDTVESQQVADIVRQVYEDMISNRNWSHLSRLVQFNPSTTTDKPSHLKVPENIKEVEFIKYDVRCKEDDDFRYETVHYMYPDEFLNHINSRRSSDDTVDIINNGDGTKLMIKNDQPPQYWTSFDDQYVVFDSYNKNIESTIQNTKMQSKAFITPTWTHRDDFVPDLPVEAFSKLQNEAKSVAFLVLKQMVNEKAEMNSQKQSRWLARKNWTTEGGVRYPDYGRRSGRGRKDPTFQRDSH
mgnify:CR=1 FL=1